MPIEFDCPVCGQRISAPDASLGATGPCPHCRTPITAPSSPGEPATTPSPGTEASARPPSVGASLAFEEDGGPGGNGLAVPPSGQLDLGAILSESWQVVRDNPALLIGGTAVVVVIAASLSAPGEVLAQTMGRDAAIVRELQAVVGILLTPLVPGLLYIADQLLVDGHSDIAMLFRGYRHFFTFVGANILYQLAVAAGLLALIVGAFYMAAALGLYQMEIVDRRAGAIDALRRSWEATRGQLLTVFLIMLVLGLIAIAGLFACCVGIVVTVPIALVGQAIVYRELRGLQGVRE